MAGGSVSPPARSSGSCMALHFTCREALVGVDGIAPRQIFASGFGERSPQAVPSAGDNRMDVGSARSAQAVSSHPEAWPSSGETPLLG